MCTGFRPGGFCGIFKQDWGPVGIPMENLSGLLHSLQFLTVFTEKKTVGDPAGPSPPNPKPPHTPHHQYAPLNTTLQKERMKRQFSLVKRVEK